MKNTLRFFQTPAALLTFSLGAMVLAICVYAGFAIKQGYDAAISQIQDATQNLAALLYQDVNESITGVDRILRVAVSLIEMQPETLEPDDDFLEPFIKRQKFIRPEIVSLYVVNAQGTVLFPRPRSGALPVSVADRDYFKQLRESGTHETLISKPLVGRLSGSQVVVMARSIRNGRGEFAGVVAATLPVSRYAEQFAKLNRGPGDIFALFDKDRDMFLRFPDHNGLGQGELDDAQLNQLMDTGRKRGSFRGVSRLDSAERLYAYRLIDGLSLVVLVGSSTDDYLAAWRADLARTVTLVLAFSILAVTFRWMILRSWQRQDEGRRRTETIIESSPVAIYTRDPRGLITQWNKASETLFGWTAQEAIGQLLKGLSPDQRQVSQSLIQRVLSGETIADLELTREHKSGALVEINATMAPLRDSQGNVTGVLSVATDISEKRRAEQRLEHMAYHDALTHLPNRTLLEDRFNQAAALATRNHTQLALLFLDLDDFKTINDSLGHGVGDRILQETASRLQRCLRFSDTVSRNGGDEFLILIQDLPGVEPVSRMIDAIHEAIRHPYVADGYELACTVSIGVSLFPRDGTNFDSLLRQADLAMYQAKGLGKDATKYFDSNMNTQAQNFLQVTNDLRKAIARNEFELHYQPQFELKTGKLIGVEALIRWHHPLKGWIPPGQFIPVAEDSGLILPIGEWVLHEACRQAAAWAAEGLTSIVVAVNLSAVQFKRGRVEHVVHDALAATGLDPRFLELELTESILINDVDDVLAVVRRLKNLGLKISIDDFGTGYSSLAYLKRFPADKLKIDQGFVRNMTSDGGDAAIVRAIIHMANSLGLTTISEGIETDEVATLLKEMGCHEGQGYFFARPMPAAHITAFALQS